MFLQKGLDLREAARPLLVALQALWMHLLATARRIHSHAQGSFHHSPESSLQAGSSEHQPWWAFLQPRKKKNEGLEEADDASSSQQEAAKHKRALQLHAAGLDKEKALDPEGG
jgi:hypothetical protein